MSRHTAGIETDGRAAKSASVYYDCLDHDPHARGHRRTMERRESEGRKGVAVDGEAFFGQYQGHGQGKKLLSLLPLAHAAFEFYGRCFRQSPGARAVKTTCLKGDQVGRRRKVMVERGQAARGASQTRSVLVVMMYCEGCRDGKRMRRRRRHTLMPRNVIRSSR